MRRVKQANFAPLLAGAFVLAAVAAFALLSARGNHAEAVTTITIEVSSNKFCTPGQSPCPDTPLDTTVAAIVGDTISFQLVSGFHTSSHCTDNTFTDCSGNLFDFGTGGAGNWLVPGGVNNTNVYFRCNIHIGMQGLVVVGSPTTPTPTPAPTPTPVPTPTPAPVSVGGLADFPDIDQSPSEAPGSSEGSSFVLVALVSGLVVALAMFAAGAWYVRMRWLR